MPAPAAGADVVDVMDAALDARAKGDERLAVDRRKGLDEAAGAGAGGAGVVDEGGSGGGAAGPTDVGRPPGVTARRTGPLRLLGPDGSGPP